MAALENPARVAWEMADEGILDGVYIRMKRGDLTRPCRNQMVIRIANDSDFTVSYSSTRIVQLVELPIRWCGLDCFELDWTPVCQRWGSAAIFREHFENGVRGLEENGQHFWQYFHYDSPRFGRPLASRWHVPSLQTPLDSIDRVLYINIARRTDRRAEISGELQRLGIAEDSIVRIEAVDAQECEETPIVVLDIFPSSTQATGVVILSPLADASLSLFSWEGCTEKSKSNVPQSRAEKRR